MLLLYAIFSFYSLFRDCFRTNDRQHHFHQYCIIQSIKYDGTWLSLWPNLAHTLPIECLMVKSIQWSWAKFLSQGGGPIRPLWNPVPLTDPIFRTRVPVVTLNHMFMSTVKVIRAVWKPFFPILIPSLYDFTHRVLL